MTTKSIIGATVLAYEETDNGDMTILLRCIDGSHAFVSINSNEGGIDDIRSKEILSENLIAGYDKILRKELKDEYNARQVKV